MSKIVQSFVLIIFLSINLISFLAACNYVDSKKEILSPNKKEDKVNKCLSTLTELEIHEFMNDFYPKYDKNHLKNKDINICEEYLKYKNETSPLSIEKLSDISFISDYNQEYIKLPSGEVLFINNDSAGLYNPQNKQFELISNNISDFTNKFCGVYNKSFYINKSSIYYCGAVFDVKTKSFSKGNGEIIKRLTLFDKKISSRKWRDKQNVEIVTIFNNGKVLFKSNCQYKSNKALGCDEIYLEDPINKIKYKSGKFKYKKDNFSAIPLGKEKILIYGGQTNNNEKLNSELVCSNKYLESYDPETGNISIVKKFDENFLYYYQILSTKNNLLLIVDDLNHGIVLYLFDLKTKKFVHYLVLSHQVVMFHISENKVLLIPIVKDVESICGHRVCADLLDINSWSLTKLSNICLSFPFQKLIPVDDNSILVINNAKCSERKFKGINIEKSFLISTNKKIKGELNDNNY